MSWLRRRWRWLAAALVGALLWGFGPAALRRMAIFRVRRIEVSGATYLTATDVARTLRLGPNASIFDPVEPRRRKVLAIDGVARVEVRRRIPGTLEFQVREFEAVALAPVKGKLALVDRRGRVLPFDPTRARTDLPIATPDSAIAGLIGRVREADPEMFAAVTQASRDRATIVLETGSHRLLFRVGASPKDIQAAGAVLGEVGRRGWRVAEVDARFDGRVIVRRGG